ncbi:WRKY transcription factor 35 family protein [Tripterygium wilfordii]|uniref:WRKY transcription factor 35 family protein n=1 Tax=Tripterygium wilfordii TaxID=458696 RepID=A0A7J7C542_TRIWF|nr:probable WRKY transcription factor 35 [Tripterygium wilfordii]KAF5729279.1 WRKY transcription factor 35 family protein [Tripterygium wilfordii]
MENYQGDLTDILRASGGIGGKSVSETAAAVPSVSNWEFSPSEYSIMDQTVASTTTPFGDPFSNMQDPLLLHHLNNNIPGSCFFISSPNSSLDNTSTSNTVVVADHHHQKGFDHEEMMKSPCNIFSRIQISQTTSPPAKLPVSPSDLSPVVVSNGMINANISKDCLIENTVTPVQISSPRNLGIKRRKSQAKKVVCIPAPAAPNGRQSGEVVPSDLWAWRKYGQKPIKGSPYPRGYYRCSSSKGCSARKQVERSRTNPNMLVITYTSEHNHPWPTQRNALAGSTRSQPPKTNTTTSTTNSSKTSSSTSTSHQAQAKEEQKESSSNDNSASLSPIMPSSTSNSVKEENIEEFDHKNLENIDDVDDQFSDGFQNFFAELGELEADPLSLLFTTQGKESKGMDPFTLFDWSSGDNNTQFDNK